MYTAPINLVLYYAGFGFVLFLVWGVIAFDAVKLERPTYAKAATAALTVVGVAHPAAALGAWDLRRQLGTTGSEAPPTPTFRGFLPVIASVVVAVVATVLFLA